MSLDFLSGLLLVAVVGATAIFVIKELTRDGATEHKKTRNRFTSALELLSGADAEPVNENMVGLIGKVISHSSDSARPMRVRLGPESWPARLDSIEEDALPVGETVEVIAVDGAVVVVVAKATPAQAPDDGR